eukprot:scaffold44078_cov26-Cyclotella_meneghiniana.AAC.2
MYRRHPSIGLHDHRTRTNRPHGISNNQLMIMTVETPRAVIVRLSTVTSTSPAGRCPKCCSQ